MTKPKCPAPVKHVTAHVQTPAPEDAVTASSLAAPTVRAEEMPPPSPQVDNNCMQMLVSLLDRALSQNSQAAVRGQRPFSPADRQPCRLCKSLEHSTLSHCRRSGLCLVCLERGHIKRDCPKCNPSQDQQAPQPSQLNSQAHI